MLAPFHLAIPVRDLDKTRSFYRDVLGCAEGRSSDLWVDFNFFGHQLVIHMFGEANTNLESNPVDGDDVPIPHFGIVLTWTDWTNLSEDLTNQGIEFIIEPCIRFKGLPGEQATMFFLDPSGNALEFKAFQNIDGLFAK